MTDDEDVDFSDEPWYVFYMRAAAIIGPLAVLSLLARIFGLVPW